MRLIDADVLIEKLEAWKKEAERRAANINYTFASAIIAQVNAEPTIEERKTGRWEKLMMYLADLQLTYSPDWGANGCGDEKLYEFVTGLIEELEGWEDGGGA